MHVSKTWKACRDVFRAVLYAPGATTLTHLRRYYIAYWILQCLVNRHLLNLVLVHSLANVFHRILTEGPKDVT